MGVVAVTATDSVVDFGVKQISFSLLIAQAVEEALLVGRLRHQVLGQSMLRKHGSESLASAVRDNGENG